MHGAREVGTSQERYMVGLRPLTSQDLERYFEESVIEVLSRVEGPDTPIYVVSMDEEKAGHLRDTFGSCVIVEKESNVKPQEGDG